jgi:hypothetical protein
MLYKEIDLLKKPTKKWNHIVDVNKKVFN